MTSPYAPWRTDGVGAEQVVIDDHDVGGGRALAHARDEAVVVLAGSPSPRQFSLVAAMLAQNGTSSGRSVEFGAVAGLGARRPVVDHLQVARGRAGEPASMSSRNASNRWRQR